ncbi:hypothetical protein L202_05183 [Cryptococcus amylolentus CBS 6039]|uniref:Uncharacterized protein n=2 Tax=Cryptococcus amylolentus TaxID=104669 RepID=A0A1E3HLC8_9TREE|nr:hypothetical protein L202_05183 [Cryptococcus amylolentus CBS 6039]ODN76516.1 hypothetical protein L202_05183 [Cryptococcus amylolentus CBS 6039]ODO04508.1 hypothetical protein I350_05112 [Cryptococcus amylolentus CBS 6273]
MAIVQDITAGEDQVASSLDELLASLRALVKGLDLPVNVFNQTDEFALSQYASTTFLSIKQISTQITKVDEDWGWDDVSAEQQAQLLGPIIRLSGDDPWSSPSIRREIDSIQPHLPKSLPLTLLQSLRPSFAPHPSLSSASRPLPRATAGSEAEGTIDMHDVQPFKDVSSWGVCNILSWSAARLTREEIERYLGIVLPPTLVLMDDYEPRWRERGISALSTWIFTLPPQTLRNMRLPALLLPSLIHSLALHPHPPQPSILPTTLRFLRYTTEQGSEERARWIEEIVERGLVDGWTYAKDGKEGREVQIGLAREVEVLCGELGTGIARWTKQIIPNLLNPLQYAPTPLTVPHLTANLSALLCLVRTLSLTGLGARWRGKVMNVLARQWILSKERKGLDSGDDGDGDVVVKPIMELIQRTINELDEQFPGDVPKDLEVLRGMAEGQLDDLLLLP